METVIVRTIFLYLIILLTFRLMGKREIGQLSVVDFVVNIMIAELCVVAIEQPNAPMTRTIIPIAILLLIQLLLAWFSLKSQTVRHLVDGQPSLIIKNGEIDERQMRKQRYNFDDLLMQLREQNIKNVGDVEFAFLETDGKLSVIRKEEEKEKEEEQEQPVWEIDHTLLPLPLILDGEIQERNLQILDKNQFWLRQELRKIGYKDIKGISVCILDDKGTFFIDEKNKWN
ncbi:DUF421 domain-containing protein [Pullulanibacillus sp. KACC 23026]|uniref:DUF421 domain-containing protein n=1 Tax=Pullulanibacillus sp. KACC 23026 TaxID=3028315 RepID=UPI0031B60F98